MKTDLRDYLYSTALISLAVAGAAALMVFLTGWLVGALGPVLAPITLFCVIAGGYGIFTALELGILARWLPLTPGTYDTGHSQFTLWKVQHVVGELGKVALSLFFPVFARPAFYALFGARVGRSVAVAGKILDPRLTVLEDGCVIGEGCIITSHAMAGDRFVLREVRVGRGATVGVGCIIMPGVRIGPGAIVLPGSVLKAETEVPAGEIWGGVPATRLGGKTAP